jgi:hypothetical protein
LLNREYGEKQNHVGVKKLYNTLKTRSNDFPTRRFIEDFLNRQERFQVFKQNRVKVDTITVTSTFERAFDAWYHRYSSTAEFAPFSGHESLGCVVYVLRGYQY